jgi:tRNA-Thr(GGU) m(6)t(6)A37 methyltransferase TsaA
MAYKIEMTSIGTVKNKMNEPVDDQFGGVISRIELDSDRFKPETLRGLEDFSHVEIIFVLHGIPESDVSLAPRHPRGRKDWPELGIFAQRAKRRPNRIAITVCKLLRVDGLAIEVESLDAINGTPVLDIKPWVAEFGPRGPVRQPRWTTELMAGYWSSGQ